MFVYTIQPVVKPVVKPGWQPVVSCIQTFNQLSNRVVQLVWQNGCIVYTAGCQTGCTTRFDNRTGCTTRFDNRLDVCLHDTAGCQPVVPVASCKRGFTLMPYKTPVFDLLELLSVPQNFLSPTPHPFSHSPIIVHCCSAHVLDLGTSLGLTSNDSGPMNRTTGK